MLLANNIIDRAVVVAAESVSCGESTRENHKFPSRLPLINFSGGAIDIFLFYFFWHTALLKTFLSLLSCAAAAAAFAEMNGIKM
jgi:hypothetical protein